MNMNVEAGKNATKNVMEVKEMTYMPMLKDWEIYFDRANGYENRETVAGAFTEFWNSLNEDELQIPGACMLGGKVFGRAGFNDGDEIFTSNIQSVKRVERGDKLGVPHDLMCATTGSGSKYYFYSDGHNAYMALMLGDLTHMGKLDPSRGYYLKREFRRSSKLI